MESQVKITITPSMASSGLLEIQHAMQHVQDFFALFSHVDASTSLNKKPVGWYLLKAATNSPFQVEAQAYAKDPTVNAERQAILAATQLKSGMEAIIAGLSFPGWFDRQAETFLRNFFNRNLNGIGRTDITLFDKPAIVISHKVAKQAILHLDEEALKQEAQKEDYTHMEYGSVEGEICGVGRHYNKPSFSLRERLSGKNIVCITDGASVEKIGAEHYLSEIWDKKRVLVQGRLIYNAEGEIEKVEAYDISIITPKDIPVDKIYDPKFTGGLSPSKYLEEIREGNLD